jgi:hypothetical protein
VSWVRSGYSNYLMYYIRFWKLKNSSLNYNSRKNCKHEWCAHTQHVVICKMSQRFSLKFYKKYTTKNRGVFYEQVLTNFSFSKIWITDFRHNKFTKILMGINMAKFHEFFVKKVCDSKFWKTKIDWSLSVKYFSFFFSCRVSYGTLEKIVETFCILRYVVSVHHHVFNFSWRCNSNWNFSDFRS